MDVILLERVEKLGNLGEIVSVKPGYARNFLLPQGKALRSSKENLARFEAERAGIEKLNEEKKDEARGRADGMEGHKFVVIRQASDSGNLYGSVSTRDVADALSGDGFAVSRSQIELDKPIKELGLHEIRVVLHPEVNVTVTANVARSDEEAELQAQGKSIADLRAEEEAAEEAEAAEFDVRSLFDEDAEIDEDALASGDGGDGDPEADEASAPVSHDPRDARDEEEAKAG